MTALTAFSIDTNAPLNSAQELEAALRHIGATRYHNLHPFHHLLHGGKLNKGQVQAWALNRYFYQSTIPIKDAVVISRFRDRATRIEWRHRLEDHDGEEHSEGGIERWLQLTAGLGLDNDYVESTEGILPATRFAVEAYVHFCRDRSPLEAIASCLTELFAPNLHAERISGMLEHYDFINPTVMAYFRRRLEQAPRDADYALEWVKTNARTPEERRLVCNALIFKTNVLWVQLDALHHAYVEGHIPPGAFVPETKMTAPAPAARRRLTVSEASVPVLARGTRLRFDDTRKRWVLLVPERVLAPDDIAVEILQLCDGKRSVADIAAQLAEKYTAPVEEIGGDVIAMLQDLANSGFVVEAAKEVS